MGRAEGSPPHAGHLVNGYKPNCPANTSYYNDEILKFFPGQPGYKAPGKAKRSTQLEDKHYVDYQTNEDG